MDPSTGNYAGMEISSGRRPVTIALLNSGLDPITIRQCSVSEVISLLDEFNTGQLGINVPGSKGGQAIFSDLKVALKPAGFSPSSNNEGERRWLETNTQASFRTYHPRLFPRRTLEGRIQRALILFEEGVRIPDPMDFFEEITRHKLLQGNLPDKNMYSVKQLDALIAAYISWLSVQRPHRVETRDNLVLPKISDHEEEMIQNRSARY